jgi:hypothetical protein
MNTPRFSSVKNLIPAILLLGASARADVHHFGYATETGVLPAGANEVEIWNTARIGKSDYYYGLDQRLEFETGLTDRLQASLYLNWNKTTAADSTGNLASSFDWQGLSTEFKYKFSDPSADPIGFGLYGELGVNTESTEIEGKALFDKNLDSWVLAANLVGEEKILNRSFETSEIELEGVLAAAYAFTPNFTLGLEFRNHNDLEKAAGQNAFHWMNSALYLGPSVSYNATAYVVTFTVIPQLPSPNTEDNRTLEFHDHEAVEARLHLSLHF